MLRKLSIAAALILLSVAVSYAANLKPSVLPGFSNISTVQAGDPIDVKFQPAKVTWVVATFGAFSSFELTLDGSVDYPCDTGFYYPISTLTDANTVLARGVELSGEQCFRANLRTKAGTGGVTSIKLNMRGLQ